MPGIPAHGLAPRNTLSDDVQYGSTRLGSYVTAAGVETGELNVLIYLYNNSGGATVEGQCCLIEYTGDPDTNPQAVVLAAKTPNYHLAVATGAIANLAGGWFVTKGPANVLVEGTTDVAVGDFLKTTAATSTTALIKDGTAKTVDSFAIAHAAQAANSAVLTKCYLFGAVADPD